METEIPAPTEEELNRLRRDAGEGDTDAVAFLCNRKNAQESLQRWRKSQ
jgi:hypothetical protein